MVDTHAHLALCEPPEAELIAAARDAGVRRILTVGLGEDSNPGVTASAQAIEEVFASVGRHPNSADGFDQGAGDAIEELCSQPGVVAVGETGLDFYRDRSNPDDQRRAFAAQIAIARRAGKALVVHLRDREGSEEAVSEAFDTLEREGDGISVILHCFSTGPRWAERAAERGWYCSFAGNMTYPKS
ncbi:MAG: TatD family hydrolase, partial [Solirubrobacterales bacterium]